MCTCLYVYKYIYNKLFYCKRLDLRTKPLTAFGQFRTMHVNVQYAQRNIFLKKYFKNATNILIKTLGLFVLV